MANFQGDLTDVIRGRDATATADEDDAWPLPIGYPPPDDDFFAVGDDPFTRYLREPLLHDVILPPMTAPAFSSGMFLDISPHPPPPPLPPSFCDSAAEEGSRGVQISSPRNTGIKRRRNQSKKVVCIPAPAPPSNSRSSGEVVPSDLWAWRKYGQKPIKGSPYPRGYYRCSSSKGCLARKQVERSRTDPNMLVITYSSEHNHPWPTQRNALAGSTRSRPVGKIPRDGAPCASAKVKEETYFYDYKTTEWNNSDESLGETEADPFDVPFPRGFYGTAGVGNSSGEKTDVKTHPYNTMI